MAASGCGPEPRVGTNNEAIAYGTADTTHTAVVSLLTSNGRGYSECSGSVVQVKNGVGYVLTAAHCCTMNAPQVVVIANDYSVALNAVMGGPVVPPAYAVTAGSVYYDANYNMQDHDFCMLKFNAPANTATLALPSQNDGLAFGVAVEHVGYGVTDVNTNNSVRRTGTNVVDQALSGASLGCSQGGVNQVPGTCEGDSGGPTLIPAGAPPGQQTIVGVLSFGNSQNCAQDTISVSSRVSSEIGANGFITNYLQDTPIGLTPGQANSCATCQSAAAAGACAAAVHACLTDQTCFTLNGCAGACADVACVATCEAQASPRARMEFNAVADCICQSCANPCASSCANLPPADGGAAPFDLSQSIDLTPGADASRGAVDASAADSGDAGGNVANSKGCNCSMGGRAADRSGPGGALSIVLLIGIYSRFGRRRARAKSTRTTN
jgi:hypothetical protein